MSKGEIDRLLKERDAMRAALLDIAHHADNGNPLTAEALARIAHAGLLKAMRREVRP